MTQYISQMLDTTIDVQSNSAFARATLYFSDVNGVPIAVELDMESALRVLPALDDGAGASAALRAQIPAPPPAPEPQHRRWWQW